MKRTSPKKNRSAKSEPLRFLATCRTIYNRDHGCVTPSERLICDLIRTYQAKGSLDAEDIAYAQREFNEDKDLLRRARLVHAPTA